MNTFFTFFPSFEPVFLRFLGSCPNRSSSWNTAWYLFSHTCVAFASDRWPLLQYFHLLSGSHAHTYDMHWQTMGLGPDMVGDLYLSYRKWLLPLPNFDLTSAWEPHGQWKPQMELPWFLKMSIAISPFSGTRLSILSLFLSCRNSSKYIFDPIWEFTCSEQV